MGPARRAAGGAARGPRPGGGDRRRRARPVCSGRWTPVDRGAIRGLCARDLETTRRNAWLALRRWDRKALARHLHVMSSLAQTVGADALADEARRLQVRLRSGTTAGYDAGARRMDALARRAAAYLAEADG